MIQSLRLVARFPDYWKPPLRDPVTQHGKIKLSVGLPRDWGSSSHSHFGAGIDFEELSEAGAELAVEDGAADLEQEIGAPP